MIVHLEKRLLSVKEYHKMEEVGILNPSDRVELIRGEIIKMSPFKSAHTSCVKRLTALMYRLVEELFTISVQDPITISDHSEPEPDLALLKYSEDFYAQKHPQPKDVILLIEVSDSTLEIDRHVKMTLYAEAGIKEYWIINLIDQYIEIYKKPEGANFKLREIFYPKDQVLIPECQISIPVSDILGA